MKRLALVLAGVAVAGGVAATPAVAGLAGNPSFSHEIPVPPPSAAKAPLFADDHSRDGATVATPRPPGPAITGTGLASKQIARRLGIAESTVKVHTGNIFRRIGVTDRTSAALWAKEHL